MATNPLAGERYVRVCPQHDKPVFERGSALVCPAGGHAVSHFKTVDRLKRTAELVPVDGNDRKGGIEMVEKVAAAIPARQVTAAPAAAAKVKPHEVVQRAKFEDAAGNVLWVRLVKQTTKSSGVVYLVRWSLHEAGSDKARTRPLAASAYQEQARKAYDDEVANAKKLGWTEVVVLHRELTFVPLPKPTAKRR